MTLALPTPTQHCTGGSSQGNQAGKKNKDRQTEKGKVKLFLFADMIIHVQMMESTKKIIIP